MSVVFGSAYEITHPDAKLSIMKDSNTLVEKRIARALNISDISETGTEYGEARGRR